MDEPPSPSPKFTDAELREFITLYKEEFKERLTIEQAREMATSFLRLYLIVAQDASREKKIRNSTSEEPRELGCKAPSRPD